MRTAIAILIFSTLAIPMLAQDQFKREILLRLEELADCRVRTDELTAERETLADLCRREKDLLNDRLELLQDKMQLEIDRRELRIRQLEQTVAAWETRSREQNELIKMLTQRRRWWCLWLCKK